MPLQKAKFAAPTHSPFSSGSQRRCPVFKLDANWGWVLFCWFMWVIEGTDNVNTSLFNDIIILSDHKLNNGHKNELLLLYY